MKLNVVDIPDYIIGGKKIDEAALIGFLEDVKTMLDCGALAKNDHPLVQKAHTLLMLVQMFWNEKEELNEKCIQKTKGECDE